MADSTLPNLPAHANAADADLIYGTKADAAGKFTVAQVRAGLAATSHTHNASDINAGTLGVARGGTGIASLTTGNYLRASGTTSFEQRTPAQVLSDIGAAATSHTHTATQISDSGATGRSILAAATPAAAQAAVRPTVTISADTTLTNAAHNGRRLLCTAAVTLTVNASTDFATFGDDCEIVAFGGNVTVAQSSATVNIETGTTRVIRQHGAGALVKDQAADTYTLFGSLVPA